MKTRYLVNGLFLFIIFCYTNVAFSQVNPLVIDFVSDTQGPLFVERIIHRLHHNEKATALIFKDINERHPAGLFIWGDVVSLGYKDRAWVHIDTCLSRLRGNGIPVYAVLGNHELMLNAAKGQNKFQSRFPTHSPTGYTEIVDSVAVILLNSNFAKMSSSDIIKQDQWYQQTLLTLNTNASVKCIIVGCHHSPYTNSKAVKPSVMVQQKFVAPFLRSKKAALFVSGHSHNFEQFKVGGKQFLVIGGGGGIRQPLYTAPPKMPDIAASYKPMFHYLEVTRRNDSLLVVSRALKEDFSGFEEGRRVIAGSNQ